MRPGVYDPALDRFKGTLICLIVLGHNYFFSRNYPLGFAYIYQFHVLSFLLLPYLFLQSRVSSRHLLNRLFRILAPHLVFMCIAGLAFFLMQSLLGNWSLSTWLQAMPATLLEQRETLFRKNLGAGFLWFLPALAAQTVLLHCYQNARPGIRWGLLILAIFTHFCLGLVDIPVVRQLPYSLSLVTYVAVLGLLVNQIYSRVTWTACMTAILVCAWLVASWIAVELRFFHGLAGDMYATPLSIAQPLQLLCQDVLIILCFFAILRLSALLRSELLTNIGSHSLQIFLLHPFVWQLLWLAGLERLGTESDGTTLLVTVGSFVVTLGLTLILARAIGLTPAYSLMFPRSYSDWWLRRA